MVVVVIGIIAAIVTSIIQGSHRRPLGPSCRAASVRILASAESVRARTGSEPPSATAGTTPNPLVAGNVPDNGATLTAWPVSRGYLLAWNSDRKQVDVYRMHGASGVRVGAAPAACDDLH